METPEPRPELEAELERLRAENAALRENEEFLSFAQRIASVGSWTWDMRTGYVRWSEEMFRIFGITPDDFDNTPESAANMFHPEDRAAAADAVREVLEHGTARQGAEYRVLRPDGQVRWVWGEGVLVEYDEEGHPTRMIGTVGDITERRAAQAALLRSNESLHLALAAARMGIWEWTRDGMRWSDEVLEMHGLTAGSTTPDFDTFLAHLHADDRARVDSTVRAALLDPELGNNYEVEYRALLPDGKERGVFSKGRVFRDESGKPARMAGVAVDVSERRSLELELQSAQRMESLGRLAGGVAHDFNNLLTAILGSVELALARLDDRDVVESHLATIEEASRRAGELTLQLLSFARRQRIERRVFDLTALIRDTDRLLHRVLGEDIEVIARADTELWPVDGDPSQVQQVLVNLALNARDGMPSGGKLSVQARNVHGTPRPPAATLAPGDYVLVSVEDDGVGMTRGVLQRAFEPFFTTKHTGHGLGLASSLGTVEQLGGTILAESALGHGSVFHVYLPRAARGLEQTGSTSPRALPTGDETILLVEDEPSLLRMLGTQLEDCGFRVLTAPDGASALEVARTTSSVDALVSDVVMPGMRGTELAAKLRETRPDVSVLLISGYSDELVASGNLPPRTAFLPKPFTPTGCVRALRELLDARCSEADGQAREHEAGCGAEPES